MTFFIVITFLLAYLGISLETYIRIDKAATALVSGVLCWTIYVLYVHDRHKVTSQLNEQMSGIAGILFFLLSAMTVVELIDAYGGFNLITRRINQTNKRSLLWTISLITFLLSPLLDNLTTCIVMISLLRKLIDSSKQRLVYVGMVIVAANAGGIWSPTGDVTTTMLWIGGQVSARHLVFTLFLPSLACLLVPLAVCAAGMKGEVNRPVASAGNGEQAAAATQYIILVAGLLVLLCVPLFRMLTGLPPFMGILMGLGILWIMTELIRHRRGGMQRQLSLASALQRIDTPSILFFLGMLLSVGALQATGLLVRLGDWLNDTVGDARLIATGIGVVSSLVDNVPLVAGAQAMYGLDRFAQDHEFWMLLAYATGSGGSMLLIGSAAGVAAMGMEKIDFLWYFRKMTPLALIGALSGIGVYFLQQYLLSLLR